ncbi:MAG TPA: class I SAM-dependent methyltransferase [Bryobacteraceae bacterium]|jgi:SAM-dependent methyltransferase|nr:class I SAM-dependent methyltransferase [Bryobacteraceae bacterium]
MPSPVNADSPDSKPGTLPEVAYQMRLAQEERIFKDCTTVHSLPPIFHYWSNKYVRPKLEAVGVRGVTEVFTDSMQRQCELRKGHPARFLSIGAGNCDREIQFALTLQSFGHSQFVIDCLEINEDMLERGRSAASEHGVADHLNPMPADFNQWRPSHEYDGVIASHVLHHVLNLEGLFAGIKESLRTGGCFAIADMIGRNGHLRWPEAMPLVQEFWRQMPPSYRYNHQLRRYEEVYEDWDCSKLGFEGIRAQDILPLLIENFHFQQFVAFGNVIEPFVDRRFGPNFDASAAWDQGFIDQVHRRDEDEMIRGNIKPTQMLAVLGTTAESACRVQEPFSPAFCVRAPERVVIERTASQENDPYQWSAWPQDVQRELEIACKRLKDLEGCRKEELDSLYQELESRTIWALKQDREIQDLRKRVQALDAEVEEQTQWALRVQKEFEERTAWALQLDKELQALRADQWGRNLLIRIAGAMKRRLARS